MLVPSMPSAASVVGLGLATAFALPAGATGQAVGLTHESAGTHGGSIVDKTCYTQQDNDNGTGIVSQNFEPGEDTLDSQGADDFRIKKKKCITGQAASVRGVSLFTISADGVYFNGPGPADSYNVTYYKDSRGTPGSAVAVCDDAAYTDPSGTGNPTIACRVTLKPGSYWVSVQANMDFSVGGEWGWLTNNTVRGKPSQWQNPGDGFGTGCTTYTTTTTCIPSGEGGDFSFSLS